MLSTILPAWPHFVFAVFEPISLIAGWAAVWLGDRHSFISAQVPNAPPPIPNASTTAIALQLGNLYLLLFMVGAGVLFATSEPKVVRNYLIALAIADVGHVYATYLGLGFEEFCDVSAWNHMTWGNVGATVFLFANRMLTLAGVFGASKDQRRSVMGKTE